MTIGIDVVARRAASPARVVTTTNDAHLAVNEPRNAFGESADADSDRAGIDLNVSAKYVPRPFESTHKRLVPGKLRCHPRLRLGGEWRCGERARLRKELPSGESHHVPSGTLDVLSTGRFCDRGPHWHGACSWCAA